MALPEPKPGLVIRYAYLWDREAQRGRDEAAKDRPCAVVLASQKEGQATRVWVAPITHTAPQAGTSAVEIPAATKQRLGLDQERSWIITNEVNSFQWPGPDIRPVPTRRESEERRFVYGFLPQSLARSVIEGVREQRQQGRSKLVGRDEPPPPQPTEGRNQRQGAGRGRTRTRSRTEDE